MGLGLSALVALLLLLPGIAFVLGLTRLHSPASPVTPFDQHFSLGLILALVAAIGLHAAGLAIAELGHRLLKVPGPATAQALALLAGQLNVPEAQAALVSLERYPIRIAIYLLALVGAGFQAGRLLNPHLKSRDTASWSGILNQQDGVEFVVLTAEVNHGGKTYLYSGFLADYRIGRDGVLERVVFRDYAARRLLDDDQLAGGEGMDAWTEIPGEAFVLQTRDVKTVNVAYYYAADDTGLADAQASP
ncbi:MAG TPA: hypothetical protein VEY50_05220 [Lysobacter sp.]|nr:hypothetical protein [Lysobacter sp.]